jgi:hypothetical protein
MEYIGLYCHKKYDRGTIIDTETGEIRTKRLVHTKDEFENLLAREPILGW